MDISHVLSMVQIAARFCLPSSFPYQRTIRKQKPFFLLILPNCTHKCIHSPFQCSNQEPHHWRKRLPCLAAGETVTTQDTLRA
jgi:hypothetical protein